MTAPTGVKPAGRFLLRLAAALHRYGTPAHRLEDALRATANELEVQGQFLVTPTSITAAFDAGDGQEVRLLRINSGETNLDKLSRINEVMHRVQAQTTSADRGIEEIDAIVSAPLRYSNTVLVLAYVLVSGSVCVLFGGGLDEVVAGVAIGLVLGILAGLATSRPRLTRVFPALAALIASAVAGFLAGPFPDLYPFITTLSALIVLIPGLALTVAMSELANGHVVSGSARLVSSLLVFLQMGLGIAGGNVLVAAAGIPLPVMAPPPPPVWLLLASIPVASVGFTILFQARPRDLLWITGACLLAFVAARAGSNAGGAVLGAAFGAWALGCVANLAARLRGEPAVIMLLPGLLLLVPGSIGFRSVEAMLHSDVISGVEAAFTMGLTAMALVTGLLLANLTIDSRRSL